MKNEKNIRVLYNQWHDVEIEGMPEDGEWCLVLWESASGELNVFAGGYSKQYKNFYANFGLGGAVLEEEHVRKWSRLFDYKMEVNNEK